MPNTIQQQVQLTKNMGLKEQFGELVQSSRESMGISQRELGRRTGTTGSMISYIESGKSTTTLDRADTIADALGLQLRIVPAYDTDPELVALLQRYQAAPDEVRLTISLLLEKTSGEQ
jgi:transcriptional regulator with XRE-family HTH domain